ARAIAMKMSKSNPQSAIFMTDTAEQVEQKIKKAYCPEGVIEENPLLAYCKYLLFERFPTLTIVRPEKYGGTVTFSSYDELCSAYAAKQIHPLDLKAAVAKGINELLEPVRQHFATNPKAKELLAAVQSYQVTR
ncbi:MAG: tyrosine--tRNA ligase, partial [Candidatus Woesearchaeota archaeon]